MNDKLTHDHNWTTEEGEKRGNMQKRLGTKGTMATAERDIDRFEVGDIVKVSDGSTFHKKPVNELFGLDCKIPLYTRESYGYSWPLYGKMGVVRGFKAVNDYSKVVVHFFDDPDGKSKRNLSPVNLEMVGRP